jgi:hypothetical protein
MIIFKSKSLKHLKLKRNIVSSSAKKVANQSLTTKQINKILSRIVTKNFKVLKTNEMLILSDILPYRNNIVDNYSNYKILFNLQKNMNLFSEIENHREENLISIKNLFRDLNKNFGSDNALRVIDNISYWSIKCQQN